MTSESLRTHDFIEYFFSTWTRINEEAGQLYESGLSLREIARTFAVSKNTVRKSLILQGVDLAPPTSVRSKKVSKAKPHRVGSSPYGYAWLRGRLVVDPKEIEVVRLVMKLHHAGKTFREIARHLTTLKCKKRRGSVWEHSLVRSIITRHRDNPERIEKRIWESLRSQKS